MIQIAIRIVFCTIFVSTYRTATVREPVVPSDGVPRTLSVHFRKELTQQDAVDSLTIRDRFGLASERPVVDFDNVWAVASV